MQNTINIQTSVIKYAVVQASNIFNQLVQICKLIYDTISHNYPPLCLAINEYCAMYYIR